MAKPESKRQRYNTTTYICVAYENHHKNHSSETEWHRQWPTPDACTRIGTHKNDRRPANFQSYIVDDTTDNRATWSQGDRFS